jgi:hypothetical protein
MLSPLLVVFQKLVLLINSLIHFHVTSLLQQVLDELLGLFAATANNPRLLFSANLKYITSRLDCSKICSTRTSLSQKKQGPGPSWEQTMRPQLRQLLTRACLEASQVHLCLPGRVITSFERPSLEYKFTNFGFFLPSGCSCNFSCRVQKLIHRG